MSKDDLFLIILIIATFIFVGIMFLLPFYWLVIM